MVNSIRVFHYFKNVSFKDTHRCRALLSFLSWTSKTFTFDGQYRDYRWKRQAKFWVGISRYRAKTETEEENRNPPLFFQLFQGFEFLLIFQIFELERFLTNKKNQFTFLYAQVFLSCYACSMIEQLRIVFYIIS